MTGNWGGGGGETWRGGDRHERKLGGGGVERNRERWRQTDMTGNGGGGGREKRERWRQT